MSDVLTPEEVDALLKGVSSGEVDAGTGFGNVSGEVRELDLTNPDWINRNQVPPLDFINQLMARHLLRSIRPLLKNQAEVKAEAPNLVSYADYIVTLERPSSIQLTAVPQFDSQMLFVLNSDLVLNYVDFYYGGDGVHEDHGNLTRDFTVTESGVADRLRTMAMTYMAEAWEAIAALEYEELKNESNPEFANFFNPADLMVVNRFNVGIGEKHLGSLDIVIPKTALEPFRRPLEAASSGDRVRRQIRWTQTFEEQVRNTEIELNTILSTTSVNLGELVKLRIGDILPFELPSTVELSAGSVPLFKGTFGVSNGRNAIRILERIE